MHVHIYLQKTSAVFSLIFLECVRKNSSSGRDKSVDMLIKDKAGIISYFPY